MRFNLASEAFDSSVDDHFRCEMVGFAVEGCCSLGDRIDDHHLKLADEAKARGGGPRPCSSI